METLEIVCSESDLQVTAHSPIPLFPTFFPPSFAVGAERLTGNQQNVSAGFFSQDKPPKKAESTMIFQQINN